jgi:hypothetical protein
MNPTHMPQRGARDPVDEQYPRRGREDGKAY